MPLPISGRLAVAQELQRRPEEVVEAVVERVVAVVVAGRTAQTLVPLSWELGGDAEALPWQQRHPPVSRRGVALGIESLRTRGRPGRIHPNPWEEPPQHCNYITMIL